MFTSASCTLAYEVARVLKVPLDVFFVRRIGLPECEVELETALTEGGDRWRQYVEANSAIEADEMLAEASLTEIPTVAVDLNPRYGRSYLYRGLARLRLNQNQEAIADFDKVILIDANDNVAYLNRGTAKENLGDLSGALNDYQEALRLNPQDAVARYCLDRLKTRK